jgi:hypothetical protein
MVLGGAVSNDDVVSSCKHHYIGEGAGTSWPLWQHHLLGAGCAGCVCVDTHVLMPARMLVEVTQHGHGRGMCSAADPMLVCTHLVRALHDYMAARLTRSLQWISQPGGFDQNSLRKAVFWPVLLLHRARCMQCCTDDTRLCAHVARAQLASVAASPAGFMDVHVEVVGTYRVLIKSVRDMHT